VGRLGFSLAVMAARRSLAGVSEGREEAARKLLRVDVVLLVCLAGATRRCIGGSTARPSGSEVRSHRRCGR
jgi:hypothetical protein